MNKFQALLILVVGILFGSLMTYAASSLMVGEDVFGQNKRVESQDMFLDAVNTAIRQQKESGAVRVVRVDLSCGPEGCLLSRGEMARAGMKSDSTCLWRRVDRDDPNPFLTMTKDTHFLDLTGSNLVQPESVLCVDVDGGVFYGQR